MSVFWRSEVVHVIRWTWKNKYIYILLHSICCIYIYTMTYAYTYIQWRILLIANSRAWLAKPPGVLTFLFGLFTTINRAHIISLIQYSMINIQALQETFVTFDLLPHTHLCSSLGMSASLLQVWRWQLCRRLLWHLICCHTRICVRVLACLLVCFRCDDGGSAGDFRDIWFVATHASVFESWHVC